VDQINSILTSTLNAPTTLTIGHDNVSIPLNLKVDRIQPCFVPPITTPPTETSLIISHDNTTISKKLKVNNIYPTTGNNIFLNANKVIVSNTLITDNISSTGLVLNINTTSPDTGVINIGNIDNPNNCDIYFYGRVHHLINADNDGLMNELEGFINQIGI
jgi:hypothetical protein